MTPSSVTSITFTNFRRSIRITAFVQEISQCFDLADSLVVFTVASAIGAENFPPFALRRPRRGEAVGAGRVPGHVRERVHDLLVLEEALHRGVDRPEAHVHRRRRLNVLPGRPLDSGRDGSDRVAE